MRTFYRLALALTIVIVTAEMAHAQTALKMNISVAQNSHYGVAIDTFAREVEKRTNGRYKVQNFYSGALGAERESIEGTQLGTMDLTMTSTGPVPNFVPEVAILDIPFLFRDYAHARATLDGPIGRTPDQDRHSIASGRLRRDGFSCSRHQLALPRTALERLAEEPGRLGFHGDLAIEVGAGAEAQVLVRRPSVAVVAHDSVCDEVARAGRDVVHRQLDSERLYAHHA